MDKNEKHFWVEPPEYSEAHDQASRQVIRALHELYRVDEDDQRSVERAWERIAREAHRQERHISQKNSGLFERPRPPSQLPSRRVARRQLVRVMVAVLIGFLLIGSMVSVLSLMQEGQQGQQPNTPTASPTAQTQQPTPKQPTTKPLGKSLGRVTLGMSHEEIWLVLGEAKPMPDPESGDGRLYLYYYDVGIQIILTPPVPEQQRDRAVQIIAYGPCQEKTAEGFGLGMSFEVFMRLYVSQGRYAIERIDLQHAKFPFPLFTKGTELAISVTDENGTTLYAIFDQQQNAVQLVLESSNDLKFKENP